MKKTLHGVTKCLLTAITSYGVTIYAKLCFSIGLIS